MMWIGLLVLTVGLGIWGFTVVKQAVPPTPMDVLYRTARLFTLDLDVDKGVRPPAQLWIAAVLAPVLLIRGIAELFLDGLQGVAVRSLVRPDVVVFGANHRSAALITSVEPADLRGWRRWFKAIVVVDADAKQLAEIRASGVWTVRADGESVPALRGAAVHKTNHVVVVTGDDGRNASIATAARRLPGRTEREVYVEITDPGVARTLEHPNDKKWITFSAAGLAAVDVMDQLDKLDGPLLGGGAGRPALAIFGRGPLVEAVVLELRRRRRVQLLSDASADPARPRVLLVGPNANQQHQNLQALLGKELDLLDISAVDDPLTQAVELNPDTARALLAHQARRVLVLVADDLTGGPIALTLARHLGREGRLALVTESPTSTFGTQIRERTKDSTLAPIRVFRVPEIVYDMPRLEQQRTLDRLKRALPGPDQADKAQKLLSEGLRENPFMTFDPPQVRVLSNYGIGDFVALAKAGLSPDLGAPRMLIKIGRTLLANNRGGVWEAWCEAARLSANADELAKAEVGNGYDAESIQRLLLLARSRLGDADARQQLLAAPVASAPTGDTVVIVGGTTQDAPAQLQKILTWALRDPGPTYPGTVVEPLGTTGIGRLLRQMGLHVVSPGNDLASAQRYALDLWTRRARGASGEVRVLAVPGELTMWPQLQLWRTLGARVGWLPIEPIDGFYPERQLLGGAVGVVDLPVDRATVRAFLRPSKWTGTDAQRETVATAVHEAYVQHQSARKPPGDPALRPFDQLPSDLQESNRAVVDDIPAKLAAIGLRLQLGVSWPTSWTEHIELLAEMEHGRYNVERLLGGWEPGARDTGRFLSPYLVPWDKLEDDTKQWDREQIEILGEALQKTGFGVLENHAAQT
ncbi:MAG: NAD-binding protein [Pseudonocardia sp.]|nr:NAD-binding protein [Pseudonocardia sp.]